MIKYELKSETLSVGIDCSDAFLTIACAIGCSDLISVEDANCNSSNSL
jgi:hypothetical protein